MDRPRELSLRDRKKLKARQNILSTADRLIRTRGFKGTKMRDIATAAEVSYQTLYNYFPTKAQILLGVLTEQLEGLNRQLEEVLQAYEGDLIAALDQLIRTLFEMIAPDNKELWRIAMIELLKQDSDASLIFRVVDEPTHQMLVRLLQAARSTGELHPGVDVSMLAAILFDLADYKMLRFLIDPEAQPEDMLNELGAETRLVVSPHLI